MAEFKIHREEGDGKLKWEWKLEDENGKVFAVSKEPSSDKDSIIESIKKIRAKVTPNTKTIEEKGADDPHGECTFVIFKSDKDNHWCWKLLDDKNNILSIGCEDFDTREAIEVFLDIVRGKICSKPVIIWTNIEDDPAHKSGEDEDKSGNKTTGMKGSW